MIDIIHILFFLAVVSPLAVLARAWRPGPSYHAWRIAAFIVLGVDGLSWFFFRPYAGYISGTVWLALLFIPAIGLRRVADLAVHQRFRSARRLATGLLVLHPSAELRHQIQLLRTLELQPDLAAHRIWPSDIQRHRHWHKAYAVSILILVNIGVFLVELAQNARSSGPAWYVLHKLGALELDSVYYRHEWWRLITALFLHAGILHLIFNLFSLYVLGPPLERAIGTVRFCICYLVAGLGSNIGVIWLALYHLANADQLVGASGCIMGIVGAWGAFLLLNQHMPLAKQRLINVLMIVAIQTAFDRYTPQISMSAHLCGLVAGFLIGLALAPREETPA